MTRAALGLGSNLGDRLGYLLEAVEQIGAHPEVTLVARSPVVETSAVGGPVQPDFLNVVLVVETSLSSPALLELAHRCEATAGRVRTERWGPRTLDVDLLAFGDTISADPALTLPHPRATARAFVMVPWAMVDPEFEVSGRRVTEWASELGSNGVRVLPETGD